MANELEKVSGINILIYSDFIKAMENRVRFFHEEARLSDHGIDKMFEEANYEEINKSSESNGED